MRKLGIVVTFVFNNFQRKEIWRDTLKQSMRKSSILVTNVNINLQQTEVSRLILNHEWYLFWLPSILLFYLIKSGLQSQLRRFWAQQRQAHNKQKARYIRFFPSMAFPPMSQCLLVRISDLWSPQCRAQVWLSRSYREKLFRPQKPRGWDESYPEGPPPWANFKYN